MKKFKYTILIALLSLSVVSCKKDQSNTEIVELPDFTVDTAGAVNSFQVQQTVQTLSVDPKLVYSGDLGNLSYLWRIYAVSTGNPSQNLSPDTLAKTKQFNGNITRNPGSYLLEYQVTNTKNGLKALMRYPLTVLSPRPYGWLVAYETVEGGKTDVSHIRTNEIVSTVLSEEVHHNIYSTVNGGSLDGVPIRISSNGSLLVTDKTAVRVNAPDYKKLVDFSGLFVGAGAPMPKPNGLLDRGIGIQMVNDGEVYWGSGSIFIGKIALDNKGYRALPIPIRIFGQLSGVWDDLNKRFFIMPQETSQALTFSNSNSNAKFGMNLNKIEKNLLYVNDGSDRSGTSINQYAFFRDLNGSKTWFYGINFSNPADPGLCMVDITSMPEVNAAKYFEIGTLGAMALYATDKHVYNFVYSNTDNIAKDNSVGFTAPASEVITDMKLFKAEGSGYSGTLSKNNRLLFIATWDAASKSGKVYIYGINSVTGVIGAAPLRILSGFGKIKDMILKPS